MSNSYWADRAAKAQATLTEKSIEATEKQLAKYYQHSMKKIIGQFEEVYNKVISTMVEGKAPTPADLYKLDKYWVLQNQLKEELQKLGDKQAALLSNKFTTQWQQIYDALAIPDATGHFNKADLQVAQQMINQIWCADGKSWSSRIWENTDKLQQALNDNLIECVVNGRKTTELKNILQEQFNVCYSRADSLVRTEMAHIQTQAAQQRYEDSGIKEVEVWADKDERRCEVCGKLHKKKYPVNAVMPIPAHPRCRCCVIPVVEGAKDTTYTNICEDCKKPFETYNEKTTICSDCKHKRYLTYNRINKK